MAENNKVLFFVSTILWIRFIPFLPKSPTFQPPPRHLEEDIH